MALEVNSTSIEYKNKKVIIKNTPENGENISVFVRPGDEIVFEIDGILFEELEFALVGGDIVIEFPEHGSLTFPSMALMSFSNNPPQFNFGNKLFSIENILSKLEEINELPITSVDTSFKIKISDTDEEKGSMPEDKAASFQIIIVPQSTENHERRDDYTQTEEAPKNYNDNSDIIKINTVPSMYTKPYAHSNNFTGYGDGDGNVSDAAKPMFYFKATAHQLVYSESTTADGKPLILGGGGSMGGYKYDSITNQFEAETIDMSARTENMVIRAENSVYFSNTGTSSEIYLSRILRFEPQMPEGFYVNGFSIAGLPTGMVILDKNGNAIGSSIAQDNMIFKDAEGNIITPDSANFLTTFKSVEFSVKYLASTQSQFNLSITANYKLDPSYAETTDIDHNQYYTNQYTFALKDITKAEDYTYKQGDFANGAEEGIILSKKPNVNIIKDGSGDSIIVGGLGTDIIYLGAGNDTVYLSGGSDTVHSGAGQNTIYGNSYLKEDETTVVVNNGSANDRDKVSYDQVESFSLAELKYLKDNSFITSQDYEKLIGEFQLFDDNGFEIPNTLINVEMEKYYNGVYIDLDGFSIDLHEDIDGNIIEGEKINALSKFAKVSDFGFITNDEGTVTGHNADMNIFKNKSLDNILFGGEDNYKDINDIDGSAYNDTIYGNSDKNIIHGLAGNDYIDGRNGGNELYGGAGNDTLVSGSGDDYIDGGEDSDTVSYQNSAGGVTVRLDRPNGEQYDFATGHGNDTLISIENVIGSNHNDMIYGSSSTNYIEGMGGNDYIFSGQGINFIDGGDGVDKISYNAQDYRDASSGNTNANYIKYLDNLGGINVTLGADFAMVRERSGANKDALIDLVKNIEQVSGSRGNDYIRGTNKDETFWGNDGNDELRGEGGNDLLYGGAGDDIIRPGSGLDKSWGGTGVDYLELYDDGINTQAVTNAIQRLRLSDSGTIEYSYDATTRTDGTWTNGYDAHGGINEAYEFEGFGGSNGANIMYGNSQANVLNGHNGNDIIYGMGGDDIFYGSIYYGSGTDKDQYHGGEGNDTLDYSKTNHNYAMTVIVTGAGDGKASFTGLADADYQDTFTSIERFIASRGNDTIDTSASTIGMYLDGGAGKDFIYGGTGNDTIIARNQAGEILDGGGGIDTLKLAQSINFRNLHTVSNFEILDFGTNNNYYAQFSVTQWNLNDFSKIIGGANNRLYIYGTGGDDSFNLQNIDFSGFSGALYTPANSGNDTIDLTHATSIEQVKLYLDGGANTDTLKIGTDDFTTIKLTENYFNTFEKFEIADGSTLNVNAQNNNNLNFGSNSVGGKDFTAVSGEINMTGGAGNNIFYAYQDNFTGMSGKINMDGGAGNDIFYANYEALLDGKLKIDGGSGDGDLIDVRTAQTNSNLIFDNANMFKNIEKLDLHNISNTNNISMDARAMDKWLGGDSLTLDLSNATQANKVSITNATSIKDMVSGVDVTSFAIGGNYHIIAQDNTSFDLHVV